MVKSIKRYFWRYDFFTINKTIYIVQRSILLEYNLQLINVSRIIRFIQIKNMPI